MAAKPRSLAEAIVCYADLETALAEAVDSRWPNGVTCSHCGAGSPTFVRTRRIWKCSKCRKQFSLKSGTLLQDSLIGLDKWLPAIWAVANAADGIGAQEISRVTALNERTGWLMLHRIRLALNVKG